MDHSLAITGAGRAASKIDGTFNRIQGVPDRIMKVTAGPLQISGVTFTGGTDGKDEAFTSCSPCDTITANGGGALFNQGATVTLDGVGFDGNSGPGRRRDRQRRHADDDRRRLPQQQRGVRRRAVLALRDGDGHPCRFRDGAGPQAAAVFCAAGR